MKSRTSASRAVSVECVPAVKIAVIEVVAIEDCAAVRDVSIVVVSYFVVMPVTIPVVPPPAKSPEETDSKSSPEVQSRAVKKYSGHGIPARVGKNGIAVHEPGIVRRDIHNIRIGRFDDNCIALSRYFLLVVAIQVACLPSLLAHCLHGVHHVLLLIGVCVAKG